MGKIGNNIVAIQYVEKIVAWDFGFFHHVRRREGIGIHIFRSHTVIVAQVNS